MWESHGSAQSFGSPGFSNAPFLNVQPQSASWELHLEGFNRRLSHF